MGQLKDKRWLAFQVLLLLGTQSLRISAQGMMEEDEELLRAGESFDDDHELQDAQFGFKTAGKLSPSSTSELLTRYGLTQDQLAGFAEAFEKKKDGAKKWGQEEASKIFSGVKSKVSNPFKSLGFDTEGNAGQLEEIRQNFGSDVSWAAKSGVKSMGVKAPAGKGFVPPGQAKKEPLTAFKGGCSSKPPEPVNAVMRCSQHSGCQVTCLEDYQFPSGQDRLFIRCDNGKWVVSGAAWDTIPQCEPICMPACQNLGFCIRPNECNCPDNFEGPQCQFPKSKPCLEKPPAPLNSRILCSGKDCIVQCAPGHQFPSGDKKMSLQCDNGIWVPREGKWSRIPDCQPTCNPPCDNGGRCLSINVCQCPQDFRGPQCQYSVENCNPERLAFNGAYNCSGVGDSFSCSLSCGSDGLGKFEFPPAAVYTCNYATAVFTPSPVPQCIFESEIISQVSSNFTSVFGSHSASWGASGVGYWSNLLEGQGQASIGSFGSMGGAGFGQEFFGGSSAGGQFGFNFNALMREISPKPGTCFTWSQAHYKTFDGKIYSFRSSCSYVLLRETVSNTFSIVSNLHTPKKSLDIFIEDDIYHLSTRENGEPVLQRGQTTLVIPSLVDGMVVEKVSRFVVLKADGLGFTVKWDTKDMLILDVSESLWNRTAGLCGRINGDFRDDFFAKDGQPSSSLLGFINAWEADSLTDKCSDTPSENHACRWNSQEDQAISHGATTMCEQILKNPKYEACRKIVDPQPFYESCRWDYCQCESEDRNECGCHALENYFRECQRLGVTLQDGWRDSNFCPMNCLSGRVYMSCGPASEDTCNAASDSQKADFCVEGCYCPPGTALQNNQCIPRSQCPCFLHGKTYQAGEQVPNDCNTCTCLNGEWQCSLVQCGSRCAARGDPHYTTFDGRHFDFMGKCSYYLMKGDDYSIEGENVACAGAISEGMNFPASSISAFPSCTKSVTIRINGMVLKLKQNREVVLDGEEKTRLPLWVDGVYIRLASSVFLAVDLPNGLEIWWDGLSRVYIDAPSTFFGKTQGLCGTFNANQRDDWTTPEGDVEQAIEPFANKWKTKEACVDVPMTLPSHPCEINIHNKAEAERYCSKIKSSLFASCHWVVDPEQYYKDCLYDVCSCAGKLSECLCPALAVYAKECTHRGAIVDWIPEVRECGVHCTGGQVYQVCGNSCTRTCYDIATNPKCRRKCVEGCNCPEGFTLDGRGQCIPIHQCSCIHKGQEYAPGHKELRPGARDPELCTCINALWSCRRATVEEQQQYSSTSSPLLSCKAAANEEYTDCEPEQPVTCKSMHTSSVAKPSVCRPGCQCKKGFVLDLETKRCIKPTECPCHHGGKSYGEGEKMVEDCNTCTCRSGVWDCTKLQCPGLCSNWGESHFKTFDGKVYDFQGNCDYMFAKGHSTEAHEKFEVTIQNVPCGSSGVACSKSVILRLPGGKNEEHIILTRHKKQIMGQYSDRIVTRDSGLFIYVEVEDLGLVLQWDYGTRVYLRLDPKWKGRVRGLCGNYNDNENDDFQPPSGGLSEVTPKLFGDSWRLQKYCPESTDVIDTCTLHPHRKVWSVQKCNILKSQLFQKCHSEVPVDPYIERCVLDSCGCDMGGDCECLCTAIAAYAHECNIRGVVIKWRSQELCPIQCDEECSHYTPCMSTCAPPTCENPFPSPTLCGTDACVEGCQPQPCPAGSVHKSRKDLTCVPIANCRTPCLTIDGQAYYEGDIIEKDACHSCFCSHQKKVCQGQPCSTTTLSPIPTKPKRPTRPTRPPTPDQGDRGECRTGWSSWVNTHQPRVGSDPNDVEEIPDKLSTETATCFADQMTDIECRTVQTHIPHKQTGENVICSLETGLDCEAGGIKGKSICFDYEIRVYCDCGPSAISTTQATTTKRPKSSTEATAPTRPASHTEATTTTSPESSAETTPEIFTEPTSEVQVHTVKYSTVEGPVIVVTIPTVTAPPTGDQNGTVPPPSLVCIEGWTSWMNDHQPDAFGEAELVSDLRKKHAFCPDHQIADVECRPLARLGATNSELENFRCSKDGYKCRKNTKGEQCIDHEVRVKCECRCQDGLGMENGSIDDSQISVSSFRTPGSLGHHARLSGNHSWSPASLDMSREWLQIDLQEVKEVTGLVLQGHPHRDEFVNAFGVQYSIDGLGWSTILDKSTLRPITFTGNENRFETKRVLFDDAIYGRFIKIVPRSYHSWISLRVELLGCDVQATTTLSATTIKQTRSPEPCRESGWTAWMNSHIPSPADIDDIESYDSLREAYDFCDSSMITQIRCRTSGTNIPSAQSGERGIVCNLNAGLQCIGNLQDSGVCLDYEVQFYCQCEEGPSSPASTPSTKVTKTTTTTTTAPSTMERCDPAFPNKPHTTDCYVFYHCVDRLDGVEWVEKTCQKPTMYNPQHQICDWPEAVIAVRPECQFHSTRQPEQTTPREPQTEEPEVEETTSATTIQYTTPESEETTATTVVPEYSEPEEATTGTTLIETTTPSCLQGWTEWFNISNPAYGIGDFEDLKSIQKKYEMCPKSHIVKIQCKYYKTQADGEVTLGDWLESGDKFVKCQTYKGLICYNEQQESGQCKDYTVRFLCACDPVTTTLSPTTIAGKVTKKKEKTTKTPATTTPSTPAHIEELTTPGTVCPDGQYWDDCAYRCDQVCLMYGDILYQKGYCKSPDACVPGCKSAKVCAPGHFWRDEHNCVSVYDCTCRSHTGAVVPPGSVVKESHCEVCQCLNNEYVCDTSACVSTSRPSAQTERTVTVVPKERTTTPLPLGPTSVPQQCSVWSSWINDDKPSTDNGDKEHKTLEVLRQEGFCKEGVLSDIECRTARTEKSVSASGDALVVCSLEQGLICLNSRQPKGRKCSDYEIRYYCECGSTSSRTTPIIIVPTTMTPPPHCDENLLVSLLSDTEAVPDTAFSASSSAKGLFGPQYARLTDPSRNWIAGHAKHDEWIQVDLQNPQFIYGAEVTGSPIAEEAVTSFFIMFSNDGLNFHYVSQHHISSQTITGSEEKPHLFRGPVHHASHEKIVLDVPFEARYVRIQPRTWKGAIALKFDLFGCGGATTSTVLASTTTTTQATAAETTTEATEAAEEETTTKATSTIVTTTAKTGTPSEMIDLCKDEMGLQNGMLVDEQIELSTMLGDDPSNGVRNIRLNSEYGAWVPATNSRRETVKIDFLEPRNLSGLITQGHPTQPRWIESYKIRYSQDGETFHTIVKKDGHDKIFLGNVDSNTPQETKFDRLVNARYLEIVPWQWNEGIALRLEVVGCFHPYPSVSTTPATTEETTTPATTQPSAVCTDQMGLEDNTLSDEQITVSSIRQGNDITYGKRQIRLGVDNRPPGSGAWMPQQNTPDEFIRMDFLEPRNLTGVITQGQHNGKSWVTHYKVRYSTDGEEWTPFIADPVLGNERIFLANTDADTPKTNIFPTLINARYLEIIPHLWHNNIAMRIEVLGCFHPIATSPEVTTPAITTEEAITTTTPSPTEAPSTEQPKICQDRMGFEDMTLNDEQITLSSVRQGDYVRFGKPQLRLGTDNRQPEGGAWIPAQNSHVEFIKIDFLEPRNLSGIITQGRAGSEEWVTAYKVLYSHDNENWNPIVNDLGLEIEFKGNSDADTPKTNFFPRLINAQYLEIIPSSWHNHIAVRLEVLGCYHPYPPVPTTTPAPTTTTVEATTTALCHPCPGVPAELLNDCACPEGRSWDGKECVLPSQCPCYVGHIRYELGAAFEEHDCSVCVCKLGGSTDCHKKECPPCKPGLHSVLTSRCTCQCKPCDAGTVLCPTSNICINETLWCDGIEDCPDDERHCVTTTTPRSSTTSKPTTAGTTTTTTVTRKSTTARPVVTPENRSLCPDIRCPPGFEAVVTKRTKSDGCPAFVCEHIPNAPCEKPSCPPGYSLVEIEQEVNEWGQQVQTQSHSLEYTDEAEECPKYKCVPFLAPTPPEVSTVSTSSPSSPRDETIRSTKGELVVQPTTAPPPTKEDVCTVNQNSITTFDDTHYDYNVCHHILARDLVNEDWSIIIHKNCTTICSTSVEIIHKDHKLVLGSNFVLTYDGYEYTVVQAQQIAAKHRAFVISRVGDSILFRSEHYGFWVVWDGQSSVKIGVTSKLSEKVDGLCGFYNDVTEDDKRRPDGTPATSTPAFGDSWAVPGEECKTVECSFEHRKVAWEYCSKLKESPFDKCYGNQGSAFDKLFKECQEYMCHCMGEEHTVQECKCDSFQDFVSQCLTEQPKLDLSNWRIKAECPVECPNGKIFRECNSRQCEVTCENQHDPLACPEIPDLCFPGCVCPDGLVSKGDKCVKPSDCRDCVCDGQGDPQYLSFDKTNFTFNGNCTYVAARDIKPNGDHDFQVLVTNKKCEDEPTTTCTDAVAILYEGHVIHIQRSEETQSIVTTLDGDLIDNFPVNLGWVKMERHDGKVVKVLLPAIQLEVSYYFHTFGFKVALPSQTYYNKTEGLCGNCNYDKSDDLRKSDGETTDEIDDFGLSWLMKDLPKDFDEEPSCDVPPGPPMECIPPPPEDDPCLKLVMDEAFRKCNLVVDPASFISACQYDYCHSEKKEASTCRNLEAYARKCAEIGICLEWRSEDLCPPECSDGMEYRQCGSGCTATCDNYELYEKDPDSCAMSTADGCYCPQGKVFLNDTCVDVKMCKPCDDQGHYPGDSWTTDDGCSHCSCRDIGLVSCSVTLCQSQTCGLGERAVTLERQPGECCPKTVCEPNKCPDAVIVPICGLHQELKQTEDSAGCSVFVCECVQPEACPAISEIPLNPGEEMVVVKKGCCETAETICKPENCPAPPTCKKHYVKEVVPGTQTNCCPEYSCAPPKDACLYEHTMKVEQGKQVEISDKSSATKLYKAGSTWQDGLCTHCRCEAAKGGLPQASCMVTSCASLESNTDLSEYVLEKEIVPGTCCPQYVRVACKDNTTVYAVGSKWTDEFDPCKKTECERLLDGTIIKQTEVQYCSTTCDPGWEYEQPSKENCCGSCRQVACVVDGTLHTPGESWVSDDGCQTFLCKSEDSLLRVESKQEVCQEPSQEEQADYVYEKTVVPGRCCPIYAKTACLFNGVRHNVGDEWDDPEDKCGTLRCIKDSQGEVVKQSVQQTCFTDCGEGYEYEPASPESGKCCGQCLQVACVIGGVAHPIGQQWSDGVCVNHHCTGDRGNVSLVTSVETCGSIEETCPPDRLIRNESQCCPTCSHVSENQQNCMPVRKSGPETVGVFVHHAALHGECRNEQPVADLMECEGHCKSGTVHEAGSNGPASNCTCCQPTSTREIIVPLKCKDGTIWKQHITVPKSCSCNPCKGEDTVAQINEPGTENAQYDENTRAPFVEY